MKRVRGVVACVMVLGMTGPVWADAKINEAAASPEYATKAGGMIGRGLINAGTFFMDLLVHTVDGTKMGPPLIGTVGGVIKGAGCSVLRAASGVVDVGTFWVPGFNGFPASESYADCLAPGALAASSPHDSMHSMHDMDVAPAGGSHQHSASPEPAKPRYSK